MESMRVLVVDDEPLARKRLLRLLGRLAGVTVVGEAENGEQALEQIRALKPDVVLLDIRMPGMSGLQVATSDESLPPIIFTTAYDEFAVQAFEANAVDYLLKPIQSGRLEAALKRVPRNHGPTEPGHLKNLLEQLLERDRDRVPVRITARSGKSIRVFDPREVSRFHAADRYTVFLHDGGEFILDDSLSSLEERLNPLGFVRVHRAELVNLNHVRELHLEEGASEVSLADGQKAPVSRRLVGELKKRLGMREPA